MIVNSLYRSIPLTTGLLLVSILMISACDDLLGTKSDPTTEEIFIQGRIDPSLLDEVGYVPLNPFYTQSQTGTFQAPRDVYIGYDSFIYVVDEAGLHVLDLAGRPVNMIPIRGANSVIQDRRLRVYVTARRDTLINDRTWDLPVIYRFANVPGGSSEVDHIIWHPFDDDSRKFNRRDPANTDEEVSFTDVAILHDNRIYASRSGPINIRNSPILPHNGIMEFDENGLNTRTITALNPTTQSLRSSINPTCVMSFFHPPQRTSFRQNDDFILAQSPPAGQQFRFAVLAITALDTPDGIIFRQNSDLVRTAGNPDRGDGFMYEEFKFKNPSDLAYAADGTNYIFALDAGSDSLYVFTSSGIEGVAPPPGSGSVKPVIVSFGGTGDGPLQFDNPQGVAYFNRIVYVADTGNNRISRFRLNTDFE